MRPALAAHTLDEDSPAYGNVSRAGDGCGVVVVYEAPMARPPPCITDRARRGLLAFRGTGDLSPSPGLGSYGWKAAP